MAQQRSSRSQNRKVRTLRSFLSFVLLCAPVSAHAGGNPAWTTSIAPFKIADNLYYVGSQDLASYLVVTPKGNILINANLVSSPPQIRASIEKLGFRWQDTRVLVNSQAHDDHMGGAAEVIRETHAKNMVMDGDVSVVETGAKTDFLAPSPNIPGYPPAHVDRVLHDGDTVTLGDVILTAHKTAGHTRCTGLGSSLERTGSNTCLLTKYSCHVRLARESATSRYINQRCFLLVAEYALRSLDPTFRQILMRGLAGRCPEHSQEVSPAITRLTCKLIQGQVVL